MPVPAACLVERTLRDSDGRLHHVTINLAESPLGWLHARGRLSDRQYAAGELLRRDWERAGMGAQVTMRWDPTPVARGRGGAPDAPDPTMPQLSARDRLAAAMRAAGPGLSDILWRVACAGEGLVAAEKALGWPGRAGKLVLGFALDRVADYYRIPA
ncbi:DUF6456 domain-containing protein [Sphingobium algorifonticola]|uniref:DUF6456 domain-containing protein n=1 Tax=Sphingobium algorifonticola TaxID=2008318 RepID=A0A437J4S9_9SPHN|nr:DUF6456 domain-containing protein [Sphingobium algorifonticola]RVT39800.1 hypothetical protein ENE74_13710 [Sphingobium algorifonticola]